MKKSVLVVIILVVLILVISFILIKKQINGYTIGGDETEGTKLGFFEKIFRKLGYKCGDKICDAKEQANPWLCPKDCGKVYYVSKQGNDNNEGSGKNPWLTIQKAANSVKPGDTVYVKEGIYEEQVIIDKSGNSKQRITFSNFEDEEVIVRPQFCQGFLVRADYITINGFKIEGAKKSNEKCYDWTASGITTHWSNNIFENNEISDSMYGIMIRTKGGDGIGDAPSGGPSDGSNIIRDNYIHNTDYAAVRVKRSNNNVVDNNKFHDNHLILSSFNDKKGNILFYTEASLVFYCLENLTITNNEFKEPKYGPIILELDMVTRTPNPPSMAPNPDETECPLNMNDVTIKDNVGYKSNPKYKIMLTFGRDFALGSGHEIDNNVWFNGNPGSKIIEWGNNFWHDNDEDDRIMPSVWTLKEFQENTGFGINSNDLNPFK